MDTGIIQQIHFQSFGRRMLKKHGSLDQKFLRLCTKDERDFGIQKKKVVIINICALNQEIKSQMMYLVSDYVF